MEVVQKHLCVFGFKPTDGLGTAGVRLRLQILYSPCSELQRTSRNIFAIRAMNVGTRFTGGLEGSPRCAVLVSFGRFCLLAHQEEEEQSEQELPSWWGGIEL